MKAIVIQFDGQIPSGGESRLVNALFHNVNIYTENSDKITVSILSEKEVVEAITNRVAKDTKSETESEKKKLEMLRDFCGTILAQVGKLESKTPDKWRQDFITYLILHKNEWKEIISMIASIDGSIGYYRHRVILSNYNLDVLPGIIRDIKKVITLY